eukprot:scaffold2349_cov407-Prasinococcus_capsulatus_cf.AAC.14
MVDTGRSTASTSPQGCPPASQHCPVGGMRVTSARVPGLDHCTQVYGRPPVDSGESAAYVHEGAVRPGIVCMTRAVDAEVIRAWLRYHFRVGFQHIFLFFDDPSEVAAVAEHEEFCKEARLTCIPVDAKLQRQWRRLVTWGKMGRFSGRKDSWRDEEVQARQVGAPSVPFPSKATILGVRIARGALELNCEYAVELALRNNVHWLLHIDADELFFLPPGAQTVQEHFEELTREGITVFNYVNYEGVPESADVTNPFQEVTHFKVPLAHQDMSDPSVRKCLAEWQRRSDYGQFFLGYENGKSAVYVQQGTCHTAEHWHRTTPMQRPMPSPERCAWHGRTTLYADMFLGLDTRGTMQYKESEAQILHYVSCGFELWWRKYHTLGDFPAAWFGGALRIPPSFHLLSRDKVVRCGNRAKAKAFYEQTVVLMKEPERVQQHLNAGVLVVYNAPSDIAATPVA